MLIVARVRIDRTIVVAFSRHGEGPGEAAFAVAQQLLGKRAPALRADDQLYVYHAGDEYDISQLARDQPQFALQLRCSHDCRYVHVRIFRRRLHRRHRRGAVRQPEAALTGQEAEPRTGRGWLVAGLWAIDNDLKTRLLNVRSVIGGCFSDYP
jgi:hypothetical protein